MSWSLYSWLGHVSISGPTRDQLGQFGFSPICLRSPLTLASPFPILNRVYVLALAFVLFSFLRHSASHPPQLRIFSHSMAFFRIFLFQCNVVCLWWVSKFSLVPPYWPRVILICSHLQFSFLFFKFRGAPSVLEAGYSSCYPIFSCGRFVFASRRVCSVLFAISCVHSHPLLFSVGRMV